MNPSLLPVGCRYCGQTMIRATKTSDILACPTCDFIPPLKL